MHDRLSKRITVSHGIDIKRNENYQAPNRRRSIITQFDTLERGWMHIS